MNSSVNDLKILEKQTSFYNWTHRFLGTWLVIFLNLLKYKIYGYALKAPKISIFNQTKSFNLLKKNYYSNINNLSALKR